ncbi:MAG: hypothetical protein JWQ08_1711, partial [Deinococcus sp.]|nr:hypothetical protein [Deinococcus sp.]
MTDGVTQTHPQIPAPKRVAIGG